MHKSNFELYIARESKRVQSFCFVLFIGNRYILDGFS